MRNTHLSYSCVIVLGVVSLSGTMCAIDTHAQDSG